MFNIVAIATTYSDHGSIFQLLAAAIQHEKPELEVRKTELLRTEEDLKIQLAQLEESLLEELANATGNILENKQLLESLTKTKQSSTTISESLAESVGLQASLDKVTVKPVYKDLPIGTNKMCPLYTCDLYIQV